jgi:hypothetical protein
MHVKKLRPAVAINCSAAAASVQSSTPEGRSRRADRRATHATGARASRHRRARRRGTPTGSAACVARPALGARLVGRPLYCTLAEEEEHSSCWCTCWGVNSVSGGFKVQQRGARACVVYLLQLAEFIVGRTRTGMPSRYGQDLATHCVAV